MAYLYICSCATSRYIYQQYDFIRNVKRNPQVFQMTKGIILLVMACRETRYLTIIIWSLNQ